MGMKESKLAATPCGSQDSLNPTCDACVRLEKPAKGWCGQCGVYLCAQCVSTHTRSHRMAVGKNLPQTRPQEASVSNNISIKQVTPVATMQDKDAINEDIPWTDRSIIGCVCVDDYVVTITNHNLTLYDETFKCIGHIEFPEFKPNSICARKTDIVVSFERLKKDLVESEAKKPKTKIPEFMDIHAYMLHPPSFGKVARLSRNRAFNTAGECFTTAICPLCDKELTVAVGMRLTAHPERDDIKFQVQILKSKGQAIQTLNLNQLGEPCFTEEFFICATMRFGEIAISETKARRVRGLDMKTGKTLFEFEGGCPQGITYDEDNNIYVYNDTAFYWIPPLRNKIYYMQQTYVKKANRRETRMAYTIYFNNKSRLLYLTNIDKDVIETFRIS